MRPPIEIESPNGMITKVIITGNSARNGADRFLHTLAPFLALFPVMITFVVIPFGDSITIAGHRIDLEAANLNSGALYLLATIGLGVYGVALAGWSSNNRWSLLGGIRATAQMISYELAM